MTKYVYGVFNQRPDEGIPDQLIWLFTEPIYTFGSDEHAARKHSYDKNKLRDMDSTQCIEEYPNVRTVVKVQRITMSDWDTLAGGECRV